MKNLAKIHRTHEKSRECKENWKWNKAHVITWLAILWAAVPRIYAFGERMSDNEHKCTDYINFAWRSSVFERQYEWLFSLVVANVLLLLFVFVCFIFYSLWTFGEEKKKPFIRSICKHLEHFSFKNTICLFSFVFIENAARRSDGGGDGGGVDVGFPIQFAACLCQFRCYSTDLFSVYFCNVSISVELLLFTLNLFRAFFLSPSSSITYKSRSFWMLSRILPVFERTIFSMSILVNITRDQDLFLNRFTKSIRWF